MSRGGVPQCRAQDIIVNRPPGQRLSPGQLFPQKRRRTAPIHCFLGLPAAFGALAALEQTFAEMFFAEWRLARGDRDLRCIAIVDDNPEAQYLYPEFILFQQLFRRHGVEALIADPAALRLHDGVLWHGHKSIDLVYNRLTDFALEAPTHAALRDAYQNGAVVLTPNPRVHALYANKRNLAVLSDPARLRSFGVTDDIVGMLANGIPSTEIVYAANAEHLWSQRRKFFFKPAAERLIGATNSPSACGRRSYG